MTLTVGAGRDSELGFNPSHFLLQFMAGVLNNLSVGLRSSACGGCDSRGSQHGSFSRKHTVEILL